MMKALWISSVCLALLGCSNANNSPTRPAPPPPPSSNVDFLVLDETGAVQTISVPLPDYQSYLEKILPATQQGVMNAVESRPPPDPHQEWALRTVFVGIGLKLSAGFSYLGAGASGGLRMMYSNTTEPWVP